MAREKEAYERTKPMMLTVWIRFMLPLASLADTMGDRKIPRPWRMVLARVKALLEICSSPVT